MITIKDKIGKVFVPYEISQDGLTYMDTLEFTPEEYNEEEVEQIILDKFEVWKEYVLTPKAEPTIEEKVTKLAQLEKQKIELEKEITSLSNEVALAEAVN